MKLQLSRPGCSLRPVTLEDMPMLLEIYASTRKQEMEKLPHWSAAMKSEFLASQFMHQQKHYKSQYPGADFWVICEDHRVIGKLYFHEDYEDSMRIIDITLLPEHRDKGIGTDILKDLMEKAKSIDRPLTIHVESFNPAKSLYTRLKFKTISEVNAVYHLMEWKHTI